MTKIIKEARIVKRKEKYCVIGHKKDKNGKYRNFGCYDTKEEAKERLGQIYMFKNKKSKIVNTLHEISGILYNHGIIHIADELTNCINSVIQEDSNNIIVVKIGKIITLLQKHGEISSSEKLEILLPEILLLEKIGCNIEDTLSTKYRISARRAYNIASLIKKKYLEGEIENNDSEYAKMKELESLLKTGFILPKPQSYKEIPTDASNWWEHFSNL